MCHHVSHASTMLSLRSTNGQLIQPDCGTCNALAHEFSTKFLPPSMIAVNIDSTENRMLQVDLSLPTVKSLIRDVPNSVAGPDRIPVAIY